MFPGLILHFYTNLSCKTSTGGQWRKKHLGNNYSSFLKKKKIKSLPISCTCQEIKPVMVNAKVVLAPDRIFRGNLSCPCNSCAVLLRQLHSHEHPNLFQRCHRCQISEVWSQTSALAPTRQSPISCLQCSPSPQSHHLLFHRKEPQCNVHIFIFISTVLTWNRLSNHCGENKISHWFMSKIL